MAAPFMPGKAQALWECLGQRGPLDGTAWVFAINPALEGTVVRKPENLFPKPLPAAPA
jgi:methionyl-tRNA synthetase